MIKICPRCGSDNFIFNFTNEENTKYRFHCKNCNINFDHTMRNNPIGKLIRNYKPIDSTIIIEEPIEHDYIATTLSKYDTEEVILKDQPMNSW